MPFRLVPAVVTSFGAWHRDTGAFLAACAGQVCDVSGSLPLAGSLRASLIQRWQSQLGIALHRANAQMLRRSVPGLPRAALDQPSSEGEPLLWELPCLAAHG